MTRAFLLLLALCLLPTGGALADPAPQAKPRVQYDTARDRLTLKAEGTSLRQLLGAIAGKSGIEVLFDPQAEEKVSLSLRDVPLESALKQMLKGKNSAFTYGEAASGKAPMLVGVRVLPSGKSDASGLRPVLDPVAEAGLHAREGAAGQSQARWETRLKRLPPEKRQALTAAAARHNAALEKREAERAQAQAERQKRQEAWQAKRQAEQERLKATHPEYYAQRQQRIEENRQLRAQGIGRVKMNVEIKEN